MKSPAHILIIDDDDDLRDSLALYLKIHFAKVRKSGNPKSLNRLLAEEEPDLILLDMNFQKGRNDGKEGLYWLRHIKEMRPHIMVLLITAYADIDLAVESLKSGASDFIVKPWENQKLLASLLRAYELKSTKYKLRQFRDQQRKGGQEISRTLESNAHSNESRNLLNQARIVASTDAGILISGENGTGKTALAAFIHEHSKRKNEPFVSVDLGAIPENLFESELFGVKKGAFTDAKEDRIGVVQRAEGGTLFLDEIGNCNDKQQQKLLRLVQEQSYQIPGSSEIQFADVRIICASNIDLKEAVSKGEFRQDLLYRINTIELRCLNLTERMKDLPQLCQHFLSKFNRKYDRQLRLSKDQMKELQSYPWPGNIRELQHNLERAVILSEAGEYDGSICPGRSTLKEEMLPTDLNHNLDEMEQRHIKRVLHHHKGNMSKTAAHLGINRNTLYRKIDKYQINYE